MRREVIIDVITNAIIALIFVAIMAWGFDAPGWATFSLAVLVYTIWTASDRIVRRLR